MTEKYIEAQCPEYRNKKTKVSSFSLLPFYRCLGYHNGVCLHVHPSWMGVYSLLEGGLQVIYSLGKFLTFLLVGLILIPLSPIMLIGLFKKKASQLKSQNKDKPSTF